MQKKEKLFLLLNLQPSTPAHHALIHTHTQHALSLLCSVARTPAPGVPLAWSGVDFTMLTIENEMERRRQQSEDALLHERQRSEDSIRRERDHHANELMRRLTALNSAFMR